MQLQKRLAALEAQQTPVKPARFFTGYSDTGRYYEYGALPVDYRRVLDDGDDGPYLTRVEVDEIERQGYPVTVLLVQYVENWREVNQ